MKSFLILICLFALACGDDGAPIDSGAADSGSVDSSSAGTGARDADATDAGSRDAGDDAVVMNDASSADAGDDAAIADAGDDAPTPDAGDDAGQDAGDDAGISITCMRTGCSAQVCAESPVATTCEFRPWYVCYPDHGVCEGQPDGTCGWTSTPEFDQCLRDNGAPE